MCDIEYLCTTLIFVRCTAPIDDHCASPSVTLSLYVVRRGSFSLILLKLCTAGELGV